MLKLDLLQQMLIVGIALSTITCTFVQKTKRLFRGTKYLCLYSLLINMLFSIVFCNTFTTINFPLSLWIGLFSFLGADTIYKSLEGKIAPYKELVTEDKIKVDKNNLINVDRSDK